jgi:lipid-binding SYLF domain-containing protein
MWRRWVIVLVLTLLAPLPLAAKESKEIERARNALRVLDEVMSSADHRIPAWLLERAYAIAVIPEVLKAGLVVGGRHGKGLIAVRGADGAWSNPSYISMTGGSVGFQAGVQSSDVVLVFRTARGVENLVNGKFTLGADASVAAGPIGRSANAATDEELRAEILSYARSRGLFAGVALDGSVLAIDYSANERVYGPNVTPRQIFENRVGQVPAAIVDFRDQLEEQTAR